jgi:small subunit ribosomal protein S3
MIEKDFVTEGLKRTRIDEYLENELERAGYGGMDIQVTPLGTMVVVYAERPGMVIGRGGKTVRAITQNLKNNYELENPQVEVKEVDVPELNPKIMAHKIAAMLQRGMHFRRVAYSALRRIMGSGAQGVEVTISGKIRGSRSAVAKFTDGYIKRCGEPSIKFVKEGFATVQLKPGVLGIFVRIMPPGLILPDKVDIIQPKIEETPSAEQLADAPDEEIEGSVEILEEITEETAEEAAEVPVEEPKEPKKAKEVKKEKTPKVKSKATEKAEEKVSEVKEKAAEVKEAAEKKTSELKEGAEEKASKTKKKASEVKKKASKTKKQTSKKAAEVKEKTADVKEAAEEKVSEVKEKAAEVKEAAEKKTSKVKEKTAEVKEATEKKTEEVKTKTSKAKKVVEDKSSKSKAKTSEIKKKSGKSK